MKKKFFLFRWIGNLFNKVKRLAEQFILPSVELVENISAAVNSPVTPMITALIPGHWDDWLIQKAKAHLPQVLQILKISEECIKLTSPDEIVMCAIKKIREMHPDAQGAVYHNIASMLSVYMSDKKITWREALHLAEEIYQQRKDARK